MIDNDSLIYDRIKEERSVDQMKLLLVAVDAKYIHSNLAVHSLKAYSKKYNEFIRIAQFSINQTEEDILRGIFMEEADVVAFSCYIWNISLIARVIKQLRLVQPGVKIWFGGPEVSFDPKQCLTEHEALDGIVAGEGEQTFLELVQYYLGYTMDLAGINGIAFKESARISEDCCGRQDDFITVTPPRSPLALDDIPFPYEDIDLLMNKIIYYESSRGCPYSCSYCLSSARQVVRFRNIELVKQELKLFLDHKVPQVKFVDRTFNCNKQHATEIWRFLKQNDNGITNFHFEITADILSKEEIDLLTTLRPGQVQLEIGVQTTNPDTIKAIHRAVNFTKLSENVERIRRARNIHQHLDLIAGLPLEGYSSFQKSFNDVYRLKPDQLQLGFLKVLKGSPMEEEGRAYGIVFREEPPYEVLYTKHLSYAELLEVKGICAMAEAYYNSGQFAYSMEWLGHLFETPAKLYLSLYHYYMGKGYYELSHTRIRRYEILLDFYKETIADTEYRMQEENIRVFTEILLFDLCLRESIKNRPVFSREPVEYKKYKEICDNEDFNKANSHLEHFTYDIVASSKNGKGMKKDHYVIFNYGRRDPITHSAQIKII